VLRFKDKAISWKEFVFWTVVWVILISLVLLRQKLGFLTTMLGLNDPFKTLVIIAIVILFYLMFRLYVKTDKTAQAITKIVRNIAINKTRKK
jgi:hypothetical protein